MSLTVFTSKLEQFALPGNFVDDNFIDNPIILEIIPGELWFNNVMTLEGMDVRFHGITPNSKLRIFQAISKKIPTLQIIIKVLPFNNLDIRQQNVITPYYFQVNTPNHYHSLSLLLSILINRIKRGRKKNFFFGK